MAQKQSLLVTLELAAQELASALNLPTPRGQAEREALCRAAQRALEAPDLHGVALGSQQWQSQRDGLGALLIAGAALTRVHREFDRAIVPGAWEQDLRGLRETLAAKGEGLTRKLSSDYREAEKQLAILFHPPRPSDLETRLRLIDAVAEAQRYRETINQYGSLGEELFGPKWSGAASDWEAISHVAEWVQGLHKQVESSLLPGAIINYLSSQPDSDTLAPLVSALEEANEAHAVSASAIRNGLGSARKELLDLGLRNPLLNYRLLRTRGLEVVDEVPSEVFRQLTAEGKAISFVPSTQGEAGGKTGDGLGQPMEEETGGSVAPRHTDSRLQTSSSSQELQSRLLSTYYMANTFIQEQGIYALFLALGMLTWREGDNDEPRKAPLVLVPVALDRTNVRSRFQLRHTGDEPGDNLSLRERLRNEFGVELSELPDTEDLDIVAYLRAVAKSVEEFPEWSVDHGSIVLGFFSFSKFLMYRDLDTGIWPDSDDISGYRLATPKATIADTTFPTADDPALALWVAQVVDEESPVHETEVARRIADAAGIRRVRRYQEAIDRAIENGAGSGNIVRKGEFLWRSAMTEPDLRDRSNLPASLRKIDLVSPEELSMAVRRVVAASYGIAFQDITGAAVKLLGFGRVTNEIRSTVEPLISQMVTVGTLTRQGDLLLVSNGQGNGSSSQ
jgi:hypothetical protein